MMSDALWYLVTFALVVLSANGLIDRLRLARRVGWWADGAIVAVCWAVLLFSGLVLLTRTLWIGG